MDHNNNNNNNNSNNMFSSDWNFPSTNQYSFNYSSEPLQEPVPFEDFQFSLDFNIPLPLEMPPVPIPETDLFAEPVFMSSSSSSTHNNGSNSLEHHQPSPMTFEHNGGAVLDENERKAFSQFLDSFSGDQDMQFDPHQFAFFDHPPPMSLEPFHEEHRQNSILQSLDEQKRYFNNSSGHHEDHHQHPSFKQERPNAVYLQQGSAISPPYIKPIRENSTLTASTKSTPTHNSSSSTTSTSTSAKDLTNGNNGNGGGGGGAVRRGKPHKELLTEEEKRNNHIASEQKRRSMIRSGFKDLTEIVPTLKNINNSKSTVLFKAVDYIKYLEKRNKNLREKIKNLEIRVEVEGRMGALSRPSTATTGTHFYKGGVSSSSSDALLQHKTQQKQLMELQEKLQLHQRLLAQQQQQQQQHNHHQQQQKQSGHHHYMFEQQHQQQHHHQHQHQLQQQRWHTEPSSKDTKMEVDTTTSAEPLKATVSA